MAHNSQNPEESIEPEQYQRPTSWVNYGDASPERHGGLFVMWDNDMWSLVRTFPAIDVIADYDGPETDQRVEELLVEPMDIWVGGEPSNGFTDAMQSAMDSLAQPTPGPTAPDLFDRMGYWVGLMEGYVDYQEVTIETNVDDYAEMLSERYGIEEWE